MNTPNAGLAPTLMPVPFHEHTLYIVGEDGEPYVPMRPIVEAMGLAWKPQFQKLSELKGRFSVTMMVTQMPGDDQRREVVCMPLKKLPGWLCGIQPSRVKPAIRDRIVIFQNECDDALWRYWTEGAATNPRFTHRNGTIHTRRNLPDLELVDGRLYVHSLELAGHLEKRHANLLRKINRLMFPSGFEREHLPETSYLAANGVGYAARLLDWQGLLMVLDSRFCGGATRFWLTLDSLMEALGQAEAWLRNPMRAAALRFTPYLSIAQGDAS